MGFTHYFKRPAILPKKQWKEFTKELQMLRAHLPKQCITAGSDSNEPIRICGWDEKEQEYIPDASILLSEDEVAFNGEGDNAHESLNISRVIDKKGYSQPDKETGLAFGFCKTARKPYDTMVCLTLISFKRWFNRKVVISSDGDKEDWEPAIKLYHDLTDAHVVTYDLLMHDPNEEKDDE